MPGEPVGNLSWQQLRSWDGSQHRAFEELCFQIRTPVPEDWRLVKTRAPDGGLEWYALAPDRSGGVGNQCKFTDDFTGFLQQAQRSLETVVRNLDARPINRLIFWVPFDLTDPAAETSTGEPRTGERQRWEQAKERWQRDIEGAERLSLELRTSGYILQALSEEEHRGRVAFWFGEHLFSHQWLEYRYELAKDEAGRRYTPERHVKLDVAQDLDGLAFTDGLHAALERFSTRLRARHQRCATSASRARTTITAILTELGQVEGRLDDLATADEPRDALQAAQQVVDRSEEALDEAKDDIQILLALPELARPDQPEALDRGLRAAAAVASTIAPAVERTWRLREQVKDAASVVIRWRNEHGSEADDTRRQEAQNREHEPTDPRIDNVHSFSRHIRDLLSYVIDFRTFLSSKPARAAASGLYFLEGEAGVGKTHLFADAVARALEQNHPAVLVFADSLEPRRALAEIASLLGLSDWNTTDVLQAMDAAGEASGARFLLHVDALNEAADPHRWARELPRLKAQVSQHPWVALAVSCRSTYLPLIEREPGTLSGWTRRHHPGFTGHEDEALAVLLGDRETHMPWLPILVPDFANPLFLRLYCEVVDDLPPADIGARLDRTAVFDRFVDTKTDAVTHMLHLEPDGNAAGRAIEELALEMAVEGREGVPVERARELANAQAPHLNQYPRTLFAALESEGLITRKLVYDRDAGERIEVASFPFQAFSDHEVVTRVLQLHGDELDGDIPLEDDTELHGWLQQASAGHLEAASTLLPERHDVELADLLGVEPPTDAATGQWIVWNGFLRSVELRDPQAVTERTADLFFALLNNRYYQDDALRTWLTVSTAPGHPLNADGLDRSLRDMPMPERDATWTMQTYGQIHETGPIRRLMSWASSSAPNILGPDRDDRATRLDGDDHGQQIVRLAVTVLGWLFTSPDRPLRDRATKATVELLCSAPDQTPDFVDRFLPVNDPYVTQRCLHVAAGVVTRVGDLFPDMATTVANQLLDGLLAQTVSPDALTRDAARVVIDWCAARGLIEPERAQLAAPPFASDPPAEPPTEEDLEAAFDLTAGGPDELSWYSIWGSVMSLGDFGRYEIQSAVQHVSPFPLDREPPTVEPPAHDPSDVAELLDGLAAPSDPTDGNDRQPGDGESADPTTVDHRQPERQLEPADDDPRASFPSSWAQRWVFQRVAQLGWDPQIFGRFDRHRGRGHGRSAHKPERMGKKYQWIALHELVARLTDNYHLSARFDERDRYDGAWQLGLRDIDPTIPPAPLPPISAEDSTELTGPDPEARDATFPLAHDPAWLPPPPPFPPAGDSADWWFTQPDRLPTLEELIPVIGPDGQRWVPTFQHINRRDRDTYVAGIAARDDDQAAWQQWHHIYGWLVEDRFADELVEWLAQESYMGRWMPDGASMTSQIYLGEIPWAQPCRDLYEQPHSLWRPVPRMPRRDAAEPIQICPVWQEYHWESATADCSIDASVTAYVPTPSLTAQLQRDPDLPVWKDGDEVVVRSERWTDGTSEAGTILMRHDWLAGALADRQLTLVLGLLGERQRILRTWTARQYKWLEFSQTAAWSTEGLTTYDVLTDTRENTL